MRSLHALIALSLFAGACSLFVSLDELRYIGVDAASEDAAPSDATIINDASTPPDGNAALFGCDAETQIGLIGYYPLDETSGTVAHDCSGNGYNGTISGPYTWVAGARTTLGNALEFSAGDAGCVDVAADMFNFGGFPAGPFTAAFWIKLTANAADNQRSFLTGKANDPTMGGWRISAETNFTIHLAIPDDAGGATIGTSAGIPLNTWVHFAIVYNGANVTIYQNAASVVSKPAESGFTKDTTTGDHMHIGCSSDWQHFTRGAFDDARYYSRALTAQEIFDLYAGP